MNAAEIRSDWAGQIIDGRFALLEWLGGSGSNGIFLTELNGSQSQKAVIKLVSADSGELDRLVVGWAATASLSHPRLMKIFHSGRSQIDGINVAYAVTEYAEEILSQIIPQRSLTPEETREMLDPVIDTLSYLHAKGFVHGHLKPSNIMVVDNQLKLSTDNLLVSGAVRNHVPPQDSYDAPLNSSATITPAVDVWSLGVTVVEALTQRPPAWNRSSGRPPAVADALPEPFSEIVRRCLLLDPANRCTLGDVKALLGGTIGAYHEPDQHHHHKKVAHTLGKADPPRIPVIPMIVVLLVLLGIIAALSLRPRKQHPSPSADAPQQSPMNAALPQPQSRVAETRKDLLQKGAVTSRVLPDVPQRASETIRGTVQTAIRVNVDASGEVSDTTLASPGPSKYFARLALESAHSWKFKPAQADGRPVPSIWILKYQFRSTGTDVTAVEETP
jgi:TonB family protein